MKNIIFLFFSLLCLTLPAQKLIDNKGNRNQSYPIVTETKLEIVNLINQVSQDSIERRIRYMQGFIRRATLPTALTVQNWLVDNFESYGYNDVSVHYFTYCPLQLDAGNVVVVKKGTEFPDEYIIISSHYDHPDGPGADDNASGTAGVMECARLLKNFSTKRSIMFIPFNAEELWMVGSLPFAEKCALENKNILGVFNLDMIGFFPEEIIALTMGTGYSHISKNLFDFYTQTANRYVSNIPTIRFSSGDSHGGDHTPFNLYQYPALYIGDIEYLYSNPCYHKPCDTLGQGVNRLDLAKAFVQATLAAVLELANAWLPPQNLSACSGVNKITVSWDRDNNINSYKVFKNNVLLSETGNNFYVDYDVEIGKKYEYYVVAIKNGQQSAPSNKDEIKFIEPLKLPYFNDFSTNKYGFEQSDWGFRNVSGKISICNAAGNSVFSDNYLSVAEMDWFSIPHSAKNVSIRFKWRCDIKGIWYGINYFTENNNAGMYFEITNDRKTWHKLAYISGENLLWKNCEFSLSNYIGSDFFQVRFRLESSGAQDKFYQKIGYIADMEIVFESGTTEIKESIPYISLFNFTPNPASTHINITTNQQEPYHIALYDMTGKIVFAHDNFSDGELNVAHFSKGNYLIVASTKRHRFARKLVIQ